MTARARTLFVVLSVAAAIAASIAFVPLRRLFREERIQRNLDRLMTAAAAQTPPLHSRLSIAHPSQVQSRTRGSSDPPLDLYDAAADVIKSAADQDSPRARHATAIGHYYVGAFGKAADALERIASDSSRASDWSDLAAARLEASVHANAPHELVPALVSVNRALEIEPGFPPALYNRAAIVERIGLREHARRAWQLALVAEADSLWQERIREHLRSIPPVSDDDEWKATVARLESSFDVAAVQETVGVFPQQARLDAEAWLPIQWGMAVVQGDRTTAQRKLDLARAIAAAVRRQSGESLAAESIAVIDAAIASGDERRVANLAGAYVLYYDARILYRDHDLKGAESKLREAARTFAALGSPTGKTADYYAVNTITDQNRLEEAIPQYVRLERELREDGPRHRAFAAQVAWQIARCQGMKGQWDAALAAAERGAADFRALGEKENTGSMESMLSELYDRLGQPERAWAHRAVAFELLSNSGEAYRLQVALAAMSRERIRREDWHAAIALIDLEVESARSELARDAARAPIFADAMARRARAHTGYGDLSAARRDIALGRALAARAKDLRALNDAVVDGTEGVLERDRDPRRSIRLLSDAIAFQESAGESILVELFLERGRSHLAANDESSALADFDAGIQHLEQQREHVTEFELRGTIGDAGQELFAEAVRIAARRGDVQRAYDYSERSRGRALAQRIGGGVRAPTRTPRGVAIIEYMVLPEQVIAFTVGDDVRMTAIPIDHAKLEKAVDALTSSIVTERPIEEVRAAGGALFEILLRPLGRDARHPTMIFIPSKILERVPWGALYDPDSGRYLIEDAVLATAPSAAILVSRATSTARPSTALVVGNPRSSSTFVNLPRLPAAANEARAIASYYASARLLLGGDASKDRFVREARLYDVLHFAGHAVSSDVSNDQSFLVLAPDQPGDSGLLYARDIAGLPLNGVRLVVLAACGTVRGSTVHLDGMPSIARSFLAAGAGAVIGTLWDVDDRDSAALFAQIHRAVASGTPVAQAVREAQIRALRSGNETVAHPKTWAGLVLVGGLEAER